MAKLLTAERNALSDSTFALPGARKFPVTDRSHAKNALARAANRSPRIRRAVARKVHQKFPSMHIKHMGDLYAS